LDHTSVNVPVDSWEMEKHAQVFYNRRLLNINYYHSILAIGERSMKSCKCDVNLKCECIVCSDKASNSVFTFSICINGQLAL
jgi:hypothetical protein